MLKKAILVLALLFAAAAGASAAADAPQGSDSFVGLEEAVRTGLDRHPLIQQARYSALGATAVTKQTRGEQYPWLEASVAGSSGAMRIVTADGKTIHDRGGHGFDPGGALPHHNQNMLTGGLLLNQLITDFGQTAHRILASEARASAAQKDILTNKALVILNIHKAHLSCKMQQRMVEMKKQIDSPIASSA